MPKIEDYIVIQAKREISIQIIFALKAFENIKKKSAGDIIITSSSIHSFLTHCANISKTLWSYEGAKKKTDKSIKIKDVIGKNLAEVLGIKGMLLLENKSFRNDLDHYDERLVEWIKDFWPKDGRSPRKVIVDLTIGTKVSSKAFYVRHYDPTTTIFTSMDKELNLGELHKELIDLQSVIGGPKLLGQ